MEEEVSSEAGRKALPDFSIKKSMCEAWRERRENLLRINRGK